MKNPWMKQPLIGRSMFEVSTVHITKEDANVFLQAHGHAQIEGGFGTIYLVPPPDYEPDDQLVQDNLRKDGASEEFIQLVLMARARGMDFILFDADAHVYESMPKCPWS